MLPLGTGRWRLCCRTHVHSSNKEKKLTTLLLEAPLPKIPAVPLKLSYEHPDSGSGLCQMLHRKAKQNVITLGLAS